MLVSFGGKSYLRECKECRFKRNGSFVDIWFIDDGIERRVSIVREELKSFLNSDNECGMGLVEVDEPTNIETAFLDFNERKSVKGAKGG